MEEEQKKKKKKKKKKVTVFNDRRMFPRIFLKCRKVSCLTIFQVL